MSVVFIDPSYFLALELANAQNHQAAKKHWQQVVASLPTLVTTSYVFDEVVTYFNSRNYYAKAVQVGNSQYSLTDCISFMVIQQRSIDIAFTFDSTLR